MWREASEQASKQAERCARWCAGEEGNEASERVSLDALEGAENTSADCNGHCCGCRSRLIAGLRGHQRTQERWMRVAQERAVDAGARGRPLALVRRGRVAASISAASEQELLIFRE